MKAVILTVITLMLSLSAYGADFSDYRRIAIAAPLINQIFTNPEISEAEDLQLQPETQIMLYEELAGRFCDALAGHYDDEIEFICFNDIKGKLDNDSWNEFNKSFTGQNDVTPETATKFAGQLQADGVLSTYLMFSYYESDDRKRNLELHFEWYLVELESGKVTLSDQFDCKDDFGIDEVSEKEVKCFNKVVKSLADSGQ